MSPTHAVIAVDAYAQDSPVVAMLAGLPWFAGLPLALIEHIAHHGMERQLAPQQVLFLKDEPDSCLALVPPWP